MPWKPEDVERHNKGLTPEEARRWAQIANTALKTCLSKGGNSKDCEGKAIKIANGVLKRDK